MRFFGSARTASFWNSLGQRDAALVVHAGLGELIDEAVAFQQESGDADGRLSCAAVRPLGSYFQPTWSALTCEPWTSMRSTSAEPNLY